MSPNPNTASRFVLGLTVCFFAGLSGCHALHLSLDEAKMTPPVSADTPKFYAEFYGISEKPQRAEIPLPSPMLASEALKLIKPEKELGRYKASIIRSTPNGQHRMPLDWQGAPGSVNAASDYTIYPNDRLVLVKDTTTEFSKMLNAATRPLGFIRH